MALQTKDFSVSGKSSGGGITYTYILRVTENSAGLVNNKPISNITVQAILKSSYSGTSFSSTYVNCFCTISGSRKIDYREQTKLEGTGEKVLSSWTGDIEHNADGKLSITVGGELWTDASQSYLPPKLIITGSTMALTAITVATACTAPTSFTVTPEIADNEVTLSWSGASGGTSNAIVDYEIQWASSPDGKSWNSWNAWGTATESPVVDALGLQRGHYEKYRIRTRGSAGSSYYSGWKESNVIQRANPSARIYNGTTYESYAVYIHDGTQFARYAPYIHNGSAWERYS